MLIEDLPGELRRRVETAIQDYFRTRTAGPWAVSTARAVSAIRETDALGELSDRELAGLVAEAASRMNVNVIFDGQNEDR